MEQALIPCGIYSGGKIEVIHAEAVDPVARARGDNVNRPVAKNRRTDIPTFEHNCGRISDGALKAAQEIQKAAERAGRISWGSQSFEISLGRGDAEIYIKRKIDASRDYAMMIDDMRKTLTPSRARIVEQVVVDLMPFRDVAHFMGRGYGGSKGRAIIGGLFRGALEEIALEWERRGHR